MIPKALPHIEASLYESTIQAPTHPRTHLHTHAHTAQHRMWSTQSGKPPLIASVRTYTLGHACTCNTHTHTNTRRRTHSCPLTRHSRLLRSVSDTPGGHLTWVGIPHIPACAIRACRPYQPPIPVSGFLAVQSHIHRYTAIPYISQQLHPHGPCPRHYIAWPPVVPDCLGRKAVGLLYTQLHPQPPPPRPPSPILLLSISLN